MSIFDPNALLDATTTDASTRRPPLPVGDYPATVTDVTARQWTGKKDPSKSGIALDVKLQVEVPGELQAEGQPPSLVMNDSIMLDTTPGGAIDYSPGRNGRLRIYREALGMNEAGQPFSHRSMIGRVLKVKIKHEPYEGELYDRVDSVAKA